MNVRRPFVRRAYLDSASGELQRNLFDAEAHRFCYKKMAGFVLADGLIFIDLLFW